MTKLTYTTPSVGEKVTVAEPLVDTALAQIKTVVNGELDTENLKAGAGVTEGQLATAVQEKLGGSVFGLTKKSSGISVTAVSGELVLMTAEATTVTLPAATNNRVVAVYAAAKNVKVKTAAGVIKGDFVTGQGTIQLELNQHVTLQAEGTNWLIVAGEPKREAAYEVRTSRTKGVEYEPSAPRPTFVVLRILGASAGSIGVLVGGIEIAIVGHAAAQSNGFSFICPAAAKWKWEFSAGVEPEVVESSYLTL
jgi:hypothetical protein